MEVTCDHWTERWSERRTVEEHYLLGCQATKSGRSSPTFRRNVLPPSSEYKNKPKQATNKTLLASFLLYLFLEYEDGDKSPPKRLPLYTPSYSGRQCCSKQMYKTKLNSVALNRKLTIPSDRRLSAKFVPTFGGRGCCVVSTTNSHGR
jgi:hypothetical protein